MTDMTATDADVRAFAHHVLVDTKHRLVFFSIPKVACTEWIRLFVRMAGAEDWRGDPHYRSDRPLLSSLSAAQCTEILTNPLWFKAAFFRDPAERLLSAYLDKFVHRKSYVVDQFGGRDRDVPFEEFLSFVLDPNIDASKPEGLHRGTNAHWRAQSLVGNVGKFAGVLDFVGRFDRIHEDAKSLLHDRGLWDDYGARGWGPDGNASIFAVNDALNRTDARDRTGQYFSPGQVQRAIDTYRDDYALFARLGLGDIGMPAGAR